MKIDTDEKPAPELNNLRQWMQEYLAAIMGEPVESIATTDQLLSFDRDSIEAITMALAMEKTFNIEVYPEILLDGLNSIDEVASQLAR